RYIEAAGGRGRKSRRVAPLAILPDLDARHRPLFAIGCIPDRTESGLRLSAGFEGDGSGLRIIRRFDPRFASHGVAMENPETGICVFNFLVLYRDRSDNRYC